MFLSYFKAIYCFGTKPGGVMLNLFQHLSIIFPQIAQITQINLHYTMLIR